MWPPEAIDFLRELEDNNDREWFRANRTRYDEHVLAPARALASSLGDLGEPRFFRPFRDTRFRPGPPIKEEIAFTLGSGESGAYYVHLSLDGLVVGAGLHHPSSDQLGRFRAAVADERRGAAFERALGQAASVGLTPIEAELKRAPKGYPPDHPRIERLRMKRVTVFRRHELAPWIHTRRCDTRVRGELAGAQPLIEWLGEFVGPATDPRRR